MKNINILRLICLNVLVIDSLRNLPIIAQLGSNLFFLYIVAAVIFLIPVAKISHRIAEVGIQKGAASIYQFTEGELGGACAKIQEVFLWVYNVLWYPTLIIFLGSFLHEVLSAYIGLNPLSFILLVPMLFMSLMSIRFSSSLSAWLALLGAILPMVLLACYAFVKIFSHPAAATNYFQPHLSSIKLEYVPTVFFSLMGIEIATMHSDVLFSKRSEWNIALWISVPLILFLLVGCGLAIWELGEGYFLGSLTVSLIKLFSFVPIPYFSYLVIILIAASVLAQATFWMQATARGITKAIAGTSNWKSVRKTIILQGVVTVLLMIFILYSKQFNNAFLYISNLSVLFAVFYYAMLMWAYWKYSKRAKKRIGILLLGVFGLVVLLVTTVMTL